VIRTSCEMSVVPGGICDGRIIRGAATKRLLRNANAKKTRPEGRVSGADGGANQANRSKGISNAPNGNQ
jgi:hypothetical protein